MSTPDSSGDSVERFEQRLGAWRAFFQTTSGLRPPDAIEHNTDTDVTLIWYPPAHLGVHIFVNITEKAIYVRSTVHGRFTCEEMRLRCSDMQAFALVKCYFAVYTPPS